MNGFRINISLVALVATLSLVSPMKGAHAQGVAPPGADETLIYILREGRLMGSANRVWIAVNDQTVARVQNKRYAVVRTKAGSITLNLATVGIVTTAIAVDDRPGETVYLKWRLGDTAFTEIDEDEGQEFLRNAKQTDPIDEPLGNNEQIAALMNLSRLGFDLMRSAAQELNPDNEHAVITIFRLGKSDKLDFGIWSEDRYLGTLSANQGVEILVPPGDHFFLSGNVGTTLLRAQVEAGKRYYALLDVGSMILRVRLTPVTRLESDRLDGWLNDVELVEVNPDTVTPGVREREDMVAEFLQSAGGRARIGEADFTLLSSEHAY